MRKCILTRTHTQMRQSDEGSVEEGKVSNQGCQCATKESIGGGASTDEGGRTTGSKTMSSPCKGRLF